MLTLLLTLVIYALIFWIILWGLNFIGIPEPFNKVIRVILVVGIIIIIVGLLTGKVAPFPILNTF